MVRQEYRSYAHPLKFPQKSTKKLLKLEKYLMREKFLVISIHGPMQSHLVRITRKYNRPYKLFVSFSCAILEANTCACLQFFTQLSKENN